MSKPGDKERITLMIDRLASIADDREVPELPIGPAEDELDGLAMAINMLVDDLRHAESEREKMVGQLRLSQERFRVIVENSQAVIFIIDANGVFQLSEGAALTALGLEPGQVVGQSAYQIYRDFPSILGSIRLALKGLVSRNELEVNGASFDIFYSPYRSEGGQVMGVLGMAVDITARKNAEREKEQLLEQLNNAQKMEAIGQLAGGVAHDFNNVLCAIMGNAQMVLGDLPADDPRRESIEQIDQAAEKAANLTKQLLAYSRKQIIEPKVVDLSQLVTNLHSMLARLIGEEIDLRTDAPAATGCILADPGQMEQVILNLAVNARDAMPGGGRLTIQTRRANPDQGKCLSPEDGLPGDCILLTVSDTGSGMSPEIKDKIFEPFFTTKEMGQGTGLGLATVFGTVKQNQGRIVVESQPGQGSTFSLFFPRVDAPPQDLLQPALPAIPQGHETILVVEDDRMVRELAQVLLVRLGYKVLSADSGATALQLAQSFEETVHMLLTDVVMPTMNGRDLAHEVQKIRPQIKVLYTSGYTDDVIAERGILEEGVQFIGKPYTLSSLATRVREVLEEDSD